MGCISGQTRREVAVSTEAWQLIWTLDAGGDTFAIGRLPPSKNLAGCNAWTDAQLSAYKQGNWTEVMFTSVLFPRVRWIFKRYAHSANAANLPRVIKTLLNNDPRANMTVNQTYSVYLDLVQSSTPSGGANPYQFMHNSNGSEPIDIPVLGNNNNYYGTDDFFHASNYVWSMGMYWGSCDNIGAWGGIMNQTLAWNTSAGATTNDRLLVYIR